MKCACRLTQVLAGGDDTRMMTPQERASMIVTGLLVGQIIDTLGQQSDADFLIDHLLGHAEEDPEWVANYTIHNASGLLAIAREMRRARELLN